MSDFIFGVVVCWVVLAIWPEVVNIIGVVSITVSIFVGGWNWHKLVVKKGWIVALRRRNDRTRLRR